MLLFLTTNMAAVTSRANQGSVARSMVSANLWLRGIKTYRLSWYLTRVSVNHTSSNWAQQYRKIPKISPGAYIFQRPFLRGLFLEGLIYGGKFGCQNRLG